MFAIAAMSRNRVIGANDRIPWRIPEELKFFRRMTLGSTVVMGRKTFESLPKPLDQRVTAVLTHDPAALLGDERFRARIAGAVVGPPDPDVVTLTFPDLPGTEVRLGRTLEALIGSSPFDSARPERRPRAAGPESKGSGRTDAGRTGAGTEPDRKVWLCGGATIYEQFLPECEELYLSVVDREVEGDARFPPFEERFELAGVVAEFPEFRVHRYVRSR